MAVRRLAALSACAFFLVLSTQGYAKTQTEADTLTCLDRAIYFEARGESEKGQRAVGSVVLNRVESGGYADSVCGVVYQGSNRGTACQFSFACDGIPDVTGEKAAWKKAKEVAAALIACDPPCDKSLEGEDAVWSSTHYHTDFVTPRWAKNLKHTGTIGRHIFYAST